VSSGKTLCILILPRLGGEKGSRAFEYHYNLDLRRRFDHRVSLVLPGLASCTNKEGSELKNVGVLRPSP